MILAADNINVLNPSVAEAMNKLDPEPIKALARQCVENGARLIDINPGYLSRKKEDRMVFLVEAVQEETDVRLILDSPHSNLLRLGLGACREKPILSALTLEPRKLEEILPLAVESGTDLVALLLDEHSICPVSMEEKISLAIELCEKALKAGISLENLIFDPVMPNLSWREATIHIGESIKAVRMLSGNEILGRPARTMAGISNILSGLRSNVPNKTKTIEQTCLAMLTGAGLEIALMNVLDDNLLATYNIASQTLGVIRQ